ncbi:GTP-binding protein [Flindersiella endophytica]
MKTVNLGIVAHVDAGKTSLTERLLYNAGVIRKLGSVDSGTTQTDTMDLERRRGITIRAAVTSFTVSDLTLNLIDTPGHPEFISEVERALRVLDGAILVVSAVEGVQAQTRILMRTLTKLGIPTLLFVNKVDRMGARYDGLLAEIARRLTPYAVAMSTVGELGTKQAAVRSLPFDDPVHLERVAEVLAEHNEDFLAAYVDGVRDPAALRAELIAQAVKGSVHPVYFGSAITGVGVAELVEGVRQYLPAGQRAGANGDSDLLGTVFKIDRGSAGEKIAYVRLYSGSVGVREQVSYFRGSRTGDLVEHSAKVTGLRVFENGRAAQLPRAEAGSIATLQGLGDIQIGDQLGRPGLLPSVTSFAPPTIETVVRPADPAAQADLYTALQQLAEQDPFINIRLDTERHQISVCLYGEVQQEVLKSQLEDEFGVDVSFDEGQTIHAERVTGVGRAYELMGPGNPFAATVGLRVEPGPVGSGVSYGIEVQRGSLLRSFHTAIEDTVHECLRQGLYGWEVLDCKVTLTHSAYNSVSSSAGDFRRLTPLVLMSALREAGTRVFEPINHYELEVPPDTVSVVMAKLLDAGASTDSTVIGADIAVLEGLIPAGRARGVEIQVPGLTHGEGVFLSQFSGYRSLGDVPDPPRRPRLDDNPLDRKAYLLNLGLHSR